jgi:hypothetical protein
MRCVVPDEFCADASVYPSSKYAAAAARSVGLEIVA